MNQIIPHKCGICNEQTMYFNAYDRNYVYEKGVYYHSDCKSKLLKEKKDGRKGKTAEKKGTT
jgi:hypothetical protein